MCCRLKDGVEFFNAKPAKGLAKLAAAGLVPAEPVAVAEFLRCVTRNSNSGHQLMQNIWAGILSLSSG